MNFTKALSRKANKGADSKIQKTKVDISSLISGEPLIDDSSVLELDTSVVINKDQVRKQFDEEYIAELAASMVELGQIQPIVVSPANKEGKYEIQKGECRWRAAKLQGLKVKAIIDSRSLSETEIVLGELVENIQRDNLKPLEIASAISHLKDSGMKQSDIAKKMGKNDAFISRHLKLLGMPDCVKKLYAEGYVQDVQTLNNLTKLFSINPSRVIALSQSVPNTGLSRKQSDNYLKEESGIREAVGSPEAQEGKGSNNTEASQESDQSQNFAHVQNSHEMTDEPSGDEIQDQSKSLESKGKKSGKSSGSNTPKSSNVVSDHTASKVNTDDDDDDDITLFRDGQPGMFSIEVRLKDDSTGTICLDRKDTDAEYLWVDVESEKVRVHIDDLSIIRTLG